jgi:hypothetical protein
MGNLRKPFLHETRRNTSGKSGKPFSYSPKKFLKFTREEEVMCFCYLNNTIAKAKVIKGNY